VPPVETADLVFTITLWPAAGTDVYAEVIRGEPVEIMASWELRRRDTQSAKTGAVALDGLAFVGRRIAIGSLVYLGDYDAWLGTGSGADDNDLMTVVSYDEVPDLKGRQITRTVGLRRYRDAPAEEG
jgi:hypothetical protein